jgi:deazaflavin-dependent oxidoreductase (nitroreductase family)
MRPGDGTEVVQLPGRPGPLLRLILRAPVLLYRLRLGRLLGRRFLLLRHRGRKTGAEYENVLEVIKTAGNEVFVVSGWGSRSNWVLNIRANAPLAVETGSRRFVPVARFLEEPEAAAVLAEYATDHRRAADLLGKRLYGGVFDPARLAASTTVVAFRPA